MKKPNDLPKSDEFEEVAEKYINTPSKIPICDSHKKYWQDHVGYIDNHDGTASCKFCPWGFQIPGYMRIHNEKVCDLREYGSSPRP